MRHVMFVLAAAALFPALLHATAPEVPLLPGMLFTLAVSNRLPEQPPAKTEHVAQGDYEAIVTVTAVNARGIEQSAFIDADDENHVRRQMNIPRLVLTEDLQQSHLQIFGFYSSDPLTLSGSTSLGPSALVMRELLSKGSTAYSFRNFWSQPTVSGTLALSNTRQVQFPVLIDGHRVLLNAMHATGMMSGGGTPRPFEQLIFDDPRHPLSLRIAWGPRGGKFPFVADFAREVVRIDYPATENPALEQQITQQCRTELPGIYFDFNEASLKPQSRATLEAIAKALRSLSKQHIWLEGHTDNIGGDRYNDDLSMRRAAAVKLALEHDFGIEAARISTHGFGARHPLESNQTLAGRARNRRVELVRACPPT